MRAMGPVRVSRQWVDTRLMPLRQTRREEGARAREADKNMEDLWPLGKKRKQLSESI